MQIVEIKRGEATTYRAEGLVYDVRFGRPIVTPEYATPAEAAAAFERGVQVAADPPDEGEFA